MGSLWSRGISSVALLSLCVLPILTGCHILVRLGEEPQAASQQPEPASDGEDESEDDGLIQEPSARTRGDREPVRTSAVTPLGNDRNQRELPNTGINFQTALAPGEGQYVYRTQLRFQQIHSSPGPADVDANLITNPHVLAYGKREDLTLFGVVPFVVRDGTARPPSPPAPPGTFSDLDDQGIADLRFFGKYRFWERDRPGNTTRWSLLGGLEVPTYDKDFSSDSWDPFLGMVWTYQSLEWGFDWDLGWQFNTGDDVFRYDELFYDAAYTYVLLRGQMPDDEYWQLQSVFEVNGSYLTDGSHLAFVAPGFQLIRQRIVVEASLQLPVVRDLKSQLEPDYVLGVGTRISW